MILKYLKLSFSIIIIFLVFDLHENKKLNYKNIIFIVADDLGWSDIGWPYNNSNIYSPNIDKLANNGIILNQSYAYPLCTPSRNSFLTGVYAEHTGLQHHVLLPQQPIGLPDSFTLMPEILKSFGYDTHMIGKWHLGFCNKNFTPCYRGFDTFYGYLNAENDYYTHRVTADVAGIIEGLDYWNQTKEYMEPILDKNNTYSTYSYTERAIDILNKQNKNKPFFMYFASQNVHTPEEVPSYYENIYKDVKDPDRRKLLGMVSMLDEAVGNITQTLIRLGLLDDTIIFFTSDNGGATYASGRNYPLRGGKMTVFEGGTRVRGFINGKNLKPYVYNGMFHAVDWMPTILHAAVGVPVDIPGIDGMDQWPSVVYNLESKRNSFIYNVDPLGTYGCKLVPTEAIRYKNWKLIRGCPGQFDDWYPIPNYDQKFARILYKSDVNYFNLFSLYGKSRALNTVYYLFDINEDPFEKENLADQHPDIVELLSDKLDDFIKTTVPPLNPPSLKPESDSNPKYWGDKWSPGWC